MELTLNNTSKLVTLVAGNKEIQARIWEGKTSKGIPVHAYIAYVAVDRKMDQTEFERDLNVMTAPSGEVKAIPARLIT